MMSHPTLDGDRMDRREFCSWTKQGIGAAALLSLLSREPEVSAARATEMRAREFVRATMPRSEEPAA